MIIKLKLQIKIYKQFQQSNKDRYYKSYMRGFNDKEFLSLHFSIILKYIMLTIL